MFTKFIRIESGSVQVNTKKSKSEKGLLEFGDSIAIVSPAGKIDELKVQRTCQMIRSLGFFVQTYPHKKSKDRFFASSDLDRAKELSWAMSEPSVRAVFCCRGGYGSARALRLLSSSDTNSWKRKLVVGYSDITYLHQWIYNRLGWKSMHGPLVGFQDKAQLRNLLKTLMDWPLHKTELFAEAKILRKGRAAGKLFGGNLSLFQVAGPAALPKQKMILLIEDVGEAYYRIDRMLQSLIDAGYKKHIAAILVGKLHECGRPDAKQFGLTRLKQSFLALTDGPVLWGLRFGHGLKNQRLFQIGADVEVSGKKLRYR